MSILALASASCSGVIAGCLPIRRPRARAAAMNPQRITLRLVKPGRFGPEISFTPVTRFGFNRFAKNPVAEDLMVRAYEARTRRD